MKFFGCLLAFLLWSSSCLAFELSGAEADRIVDGARQLDQTEVSGDAATALRLTWPRAIEMLGGPDAYADRLVANAARFRGENTTIEAASYGNITQTFSAGGNDFCIVPYTVIANVRGITRIKITGFTFAIRKSGEADWKYLKAIGLKLTPQALRDYFPDFPDNMKLPEVKSETLPDKGK